MHESKPERLQGHAIAAVDPDSIAAELGLRRGDLVLMLDGREIVDAFDFYLWQLEPQLILTVRTIDGELLEFDIEKDADEPLGLSFEQAMLDDCRSCHNRCVFCFIDQLPPGMRDTLYFKDDDLRMSFLSGNYVTLTNMTDSELDRLISHRLSPMNISVHTTNPKLRRLMMGNRKADQIMERLNRIAQAELLINAQIVLCPGLNDLDELERTLTDLTSLGAALNSVAIVPVGLTRFRQPNKLYQLRPVGPEEAAQLLQAVHRWQERLLSQSGRRVIYAADEFYLQAGWPLPEEAAYDGYPQLENGIGMATRTRTVILESLVVSTGSAAPDRSDWPKRLSAISQAKPADAILHATGRSFAPLLASLATEMAAKVPAELATVPIDNEFFGTSITVTGLLTGQDLIRQLPESIDEMRRKGHQSIHLLIPANCLRADSDVMLDDTTLQDIADRLGLPVHVCKPDGSDWLPVLRHLTCEKGMSLDG